MPRRRSRKPTRQSWLRKAARPLRKLIQSHHPTTRKLLITYGIEGTGRLRKGTLGTTDIVKDDTAHIQIDTSIHSGRLALMVLLHEMIHAYLPRFSSEHDTDFRRLARKIGFTSPFRTLSPTPALKESLLDLSRRLGPYPEN